MVEVAGTSIEGEAYLGKWQEMYKFETRNGRILIPTLDGAYHVIEIIFRMNHSCSPNLKLVAKGDRMFFVSTQDIKSG